MDLPVVFLTLGVLFLAGLLADMAGRRTALPRVTLLLACGLFAGQSGFGLLPEAAVEWYDFLAVAALTMVAFLLGGGLTRSSLAAHGWVIIGISVAIVLASFIVVGGGLILLGSEPELAILLGAIATATAPAATLDAIRQSGVRNGFTATLEGIVAIDDLWGIIGFSLAVALAGFFNGTGATDAVTGAMWEIGGAAVLGLLIGFPAAYLTGRVSAGDPLRTEALGIVFLTAGLAIWLEVSFLIAGMVAGAVIVNLASHHERAFHEIEHIQWPFMVLFFVLAGATLEITQVIELGALGLAYVSLRVIARILGAAIGARATRAPPTEARWYGIALMPQAGVAVGMALIAGEVFPELAQTVLTVTVASTVVFELAGPFATMWAIRRVSAAEPPTSKS